MEKQFLNDLKAGNKNGITSISSNVLIDQGGMDEFIDQVSKLMRKESSEIIDQYYIQNSFGKQATTLFSSIKDDSGYQLIVKPLNKEAFVSLRKINSMPYQILMINLYSKYDNDWKLDMVKFNRYAVHQMNAYDLSEKAKIAFEQNNLVDATNLIVLSSQLSKPANIFSYRNYSEMETTFNEIIKVAKSTFSFPIELPSVKSKPKLLNYESIVTIQGIFPSITYLSTIPYLTPPN